MASDELISRIRDADQFVDSLGLDPFAIDFEVVPADALYEIAAYGSVNHWHHWSYGRDYWAVKQDMERGNMRLYEVVLNSDPALAYLLESNSATHNGLIAAHVKGHSEVFKHNVAFANTRRDMPAWFALASERMRRYEEQFGVQRVERFLDLAMSLRNEVSGQPPGDKIVETERTEYADLLGRKPWEEPDRRPWVLPDQDVLRFIARYGPFLQDWQRDILNMVREEALYFRPQRYVSVLHEGFATFIHEKALRVLARSWQDAVDMTMLHASVTARPPLELNRYWLGWRLLQLIERDEGFDTVVKVAHTETDASLIRNWLRPEYVRELELFRYHWEDAVNELHQIRDLTEEEVLRDQLASQMARADPQVYVADVQKDYMLTLKHDVLQSAQLDVGWSGQTLRSVARLWGARVQLVREGLPIWQVEPD